MGARGLLESLRAIRGNDHLVAARFEADTECAREALLVVDHEDLRHERARCASSTGAGAGTSNGESSTASVDDSIGVTTTIVAPPPGVSSMRNSPPIAS